MKSIAAFIILDSVDSTNNYAMAQVHAGLAKHGMAWFTKDQTTGKGQRGKKWISRSGENIALSIAIVPRSSFSVHPFLLNAVVANCCLSFLQKYCETGCTIKWPNDLYLRDRKAGGILIENNYRQKTWNWSVLGIGININQEDFGDELVNPVSLKQFTGKMYEPELLARELHQLIMDKMDAVTIDEMNELEIYNSHLFKRNEEVSLKKQNAVFKTTIRQVNKFGQLITQDTMERTFEFGEVEWQLNL